MVSRRLVRDIPGKTWISSVKCLLTSHPVRFIGSSGMAAYNFTASPFYKTKYTLRCFTYSSKIASMIVPSEKATLFGEIIYDDILQMIVTDIQKSHVYNHDVNYLMNKMESFIEPDSSEDELYD